MENPVVWVFVRGSKNFYEALDRLQALVDQPNDQKIHQFFASPKRQVEKIDELVEGGALPVVEAEERRFQIEAPAWNAAYQCVLESWNTRDKLDQLWARHRRVVSEEELQTSDADLRRTEAFEDFKNVWNQIATRHQTAF
jgi:hypothetical protein